jgi:serine/threonine-protein kinase
MSTNLSSVLPYSVGRYAIFGEIDCGGHGAVHYARLIGPSGFARTVVAKVPHECMLEDPEVRQMFIDEACLASRIRHPNVVPILDVVQTPLTLALIMEYVHGESLAKMVRLAHRLDERIPLPIAATIVLDALHGLHAAHEATDEQGRPLGIVHRDVSPQNILVGVDGVSRLVDFGIAKATARADAGMTRPGCVKGKWGYMAPEQLRCKPASRVIDIFAVGIVFWELVAGGHLFVGQNQAETRENCLSRAIPRPSSLVPGLEEELADHLDEVLGRALARDPRFRYQSALDMATAIEERLPTVRSFEVGAWVQRLARCDLAQRAAAIQGIERGSGSPCEGAVWCGRDTTAVAPPPEMTDPQTPAAPPMGVGQSKNPTVRERPWSPLAIRGTPPRSGRGRKVALAASALFGLVLGFCGFWSHPWQSRQAVRAALAAPAAASTSELPARPALAMQPAAIDSPPSIDPMTLPLAPPLVPHRGQTPHACALGANHRPRKWTASKYELQTAALEP